MKKIIYPELKDRFQALILDMVIMFALMFIFYKIFEGMELVPDVWRKWAFIFVFFIYEPLFVGLFAGTLGHRIMHLRVKRISNPNKNILLPVAFIRFAIKALLGIVSLVTIASNSKGQGIHDMFTGSIVVYKNGYEN